MPQQPPRRRPGSGQHPRQPPSDSSNLDTPLDITKLHTTRLVLPKRLHGNRANREAQFVAHQAAGDDLREQQRVLVHQAVDWQNQLLMERSADRRAEIQVQVDNLWAMWNELERQIRAHRQTMRTLLDSDPPPA
jgi:hypothetical protein